jgi:hypothetical protein
LEQDPVLTRLDVVFRKMVAKRPQDRYQTMSKVLTAQGTSLS